MKNLKFKFFAILFFAALFATNANAQIVSMRSFAIADSSVTHCTVPSKVTFSLFNEAYSFVFSGTSIDSAFVHVDFGDGTSMDTTVYIPISVFPVVLAKPILYLEVSHSYVLSGIYRTKFVYETKYGGYKDSCLAPSVGVSASCANLSGRIYLDDNSNCLSDLSDRGLKGARMRMINTSTSDTFYSKRFTNTGGLFTMNVVPGTYEASAVVQLVSPYYYSGTGDSTIPTCSGTGLSTFTLAPSSSLSRDFGFVCVPSSSFDANISVNSNCFIPGDTAIMNIWAGNWWSYFHYSCFWRSTTITLNLDPKLSYVSTYSGATPSSIIGSLLTWNLSGVDISDFKSRIKVAVATTATLGDTLCSAAYIAPATGYSDLNLSNNSQNYCRKVLSAYDPNVKEAAPNGEGEEGYIPTNTPMTYTIHFQNTGTAAARNIKIIDILDSNLLASSLHLLHSSHNAELSLDTNTAIFQFTDIYLPDSNSDYYGSMGYVTFAILPQPDLAPATKIENSAAIYFDYNAPIITNSTLNTIQIPTRIQQLSIGSLKANVFPNPAHTQLSIIVTGAKAFEVQLLDMFGRKTTAAKSENGSLILDTQYISSGNYLLHIIDKEGNQLNTKVQISH